MSDNYHYYDDSFSGASQQSPRHIEGFLEDDIRAFVGPGADKYLESFRRISSGGKSYNWCMAIFSSSWLAYRKMWKQAIGLSLSMMLVNAILDHMGFLIQLIGNIVLLLFYFGYLGPQGNILYWNFVKEELSKEGLSNSSYTDESIRSQLAKNGGTSLLFLLCIIVLNSCLSSILGRFL